MRSFHGLVFAIAVMGCAGCTSRNLHFASQGDLMSAPGDLASGRDLAHAPQDLSGAIDLAQSLPDFSGQDLAGHICRGGGVDCAKTQGPHCGTICCNLGEWCDEGVCRCGTADACTGGNMCVSGGVSVSGSACGTLCCGVTMVCPG